jgi:hypothetical protein
MKNNMQEIIKIPVYMLNDEAKKFLLFQEHYDTFSTLLDKGVFNIKNGSAKINFDHNGVITTIERADMLYNRRIG